MKASKQRELGEHVSAAAHEAACAPGCVAHGAMAGLVVVAINREGEVHSIEGAVICPTCHPQRADETGHPVLVRFVDA